MSSLMIFLNDKIIVYNFYKNRSSLVASIPKRSTKRSNLMDFLYKKIFVDGLSVENGQLLCWIDHHWLLFLLERVNVDDFYDGFSIRKDICWLSFYTKRRWIVDDFSTKSHCWLLPCEKYIADDYSWRICHRRWYFYTKKCYLIVFQYENVIV